MKALDADCRQRVFERDLDTCQKFGEGDCGGPLQWSHVITREVKALRWEEANSKVLCRDHHCWWGHHGGQALLWFESKWPERWEHIKRINQLNQSFGDTEIRELYEAL